MSSRTHVGKDDLTDGQLKSIAIGKRNLLLAKVNGATKALDDWCNHGGCLLSGGWIEGNQVVCPCHEVGFDLDTGKNMTSPGICDDQPAFAVEVEGGEVFVRNFSIEP
jgi:3-phenylpropionate/trans-cinnamate dioxygenase ferredoxin component